MTQMIPALIMGFREGLEAFLVVALILRYLMSVGENHLTGKAYQGAIAGIIGSALLGMGLFIISSTLGGVDTLSKAWESGASFIALLLVTTFIIWMIRHGSKMATTVREQVSQNLSATGVFLISFAMVMREGTEIAVFSFAGKYAVSSVFIGIGASFIIAFLIYHSLIRVRIDLIFRITLVYLILQAGFLFGYSIHEGLSAMKGYELISADNLIFVKAYNLSGTILNHKSGILGLPFNVLLGWYSKPEWIQFIVQYIYTIGIFAYWFSHTRTQSKNTIQRQTHLMNHTANATG